jgi:predicted DNA binding CopG/RHH family protein
LKTPHSVDELKPLDQRKRERLDRILSKERKDRAISLRLRTYDLEKIKERAEQTGVPYQTLITTALHKYITDKNGNF